MSRERINAMCAELPGAEVSDPWGGGHDAWKVGGKMFACIGAVMPGVSVKTDSVETAEMLIAAGVGGLGAIVASSPGAVRVVSVAGAVFLAAYSVLAFRRALRPGALEAATRGETALWPAILACLAFTFLNPHVYLDTVLLVGGLSGQYSGTGRLVFALGAMAASFVWFFGLGYGSRLLQPIFARPRSWQVLDVLIGLVMAGLALSLALSV